MRLGEGEGDGKRLERGDREARGEEEGDEEEEAFHGKTGAVSHPVVPCTSPQSGRVIPHSKRGESAL